MALQLPNSIFFHTPKTGGCWVRKAILRTGIPTNEVIPISIVNKDINGGACLHTPRGSIKAQGRMTFSFVRRPDTWLQSYWGYRMTTGWEPRHPMDATIQSDIFQEYVEQYLEKFPNQFKQMMHNFTHNVDFVGKQENLVEDLITVLDLAKEEYDPQIIRNTNTENVSKKCFIREYAPGQQERLLDINEEFMKKFYPSVTQAC